MMPAKEGFYRSLLAVLLFAWAMPSPAQIIFSFDPPYGTTNEQVIITGSGFAPGTLVVRFNGAIDPSARATSPSTIYARVPVGATTGPISVQVNSSTASSIADFQVLGRGPYLLGFEPRYGMAGSQVLIRGWHLTNATAVKFAGRNSTSFMPNAAGSQITALVPAGATNGPISVTTTYGTSNTVDSFTVIGAGAYVDAFFPAVGNAGDEISIHGANFTGVTGVQFAGKPGVNLFVQSDSVIKVSAPSGVATGPLTVLSPKGNFTTPTNFFVPPAVTGFSPPSGRAGTNLVVRGANLLGATGVSIGGVAAVSVIATNNTNLHAVVPVGVRTGSVRVTTPAGSALTSSNFTVPPVLTGFSPAFGAPGTNVVLTGANLNEGQPVVRFGSATGTVSQVSFDQLTVAVPAGAVTGPISVTTTNGSFTTATNFLLPPVVSGFSPTNSAPGSAVTILGTNFLGVTNVSFHGLAAVFTPPTSNQVLVAVVPEGVTTGPVSVRSPAGVAVFGTFYGLPRIDGFTPTAGLPGTLVTVVGTNFQGTSQVRIGDLPALGFEISAAGGELTVRVPTNAVVGGRISVTGPAGTATSEASFLLDLRNQLSVSFLNSPGRAFVSSNLVYELFIGNEGPAAAPNVLVQVPLPAGVQYQSASASQGTVAVANNIVTARLGLMAPQSVATLTLTTVPQVAGPTTLAATVSSDYADPEPEDNQATALTTVLPLPVLSIGRYSPSQVVLGWPAALTNFVLQYRNTLGSTSVWSRLNTPPTLVGTNYIVIEPALDGGERYYRLRE